MLTEPRERIDLERQPFDVGLEGLPTIVSAPLNYFLALGQDRRPKTSRRLRLLREFAIEANLEGLDAAAEATAAKENRDGAMPVPADGHQAAAIAAEKIASVTAPRPQPPAL